MKANKRKVPLRKCLGCGEMRPKKELLRVVHNSQGVISVDTTGKAHGRGAYICNSKQCLEKAKKVKAFNKAFKSDVPEEVYEDLVKELIEEGHEN
ncbi:MAG TPA: YlxR family protein [Clostridia bacterium]|nr:YlxR family protein [Clostridia bacterium]